MCEIYGFCGSKQTKLNKYTDEFWLHSRIHQDGFGYYLVDKKDLYVNPATAMSCIDKLQHKSFTSKLALCHIRFKTHGPASQENCHPFVKYDSHGVEWSLIHNGYIDDSYITEALGTIQNGDTDSERILLSIIESVNSYYDHCYVTNKADFLLYLYKAIQNDLSKLSSLGKTNLIFTDNMTNNMYVYMNSPNTLFCLKTDSGYHFSTTKLSDEHWYAVEPYRLHIFNSGIQIL